MMAPETKECFGENFTKWDSLFQRYGEASGVPWVLLKAICMNESSLGCNPRVKAGIENPKDIKASTSTDGKSWGLMQMTIPTARDYDRHATAENLNNPEYSIWLASRHLKQLWDLFRGEEQWVVKAYNEGQGAALRERDRKMPGRADQYWIRYQSHKALLL